MTVHGAGSLLPEIPADESSNMDHWQYFNWPNIISEAKMRHAQAVESTAAAITPEMRTLEYWTAHVAHANLAACVVEQITTGGQDG
jgi:hypothetical protein